MSWYCEMQKDMLKETCIAWFHFVSIKKCINKYFFFSVFISFFLSLPSSHFSLHLSNIYNHLERYTSYSIGVIVFDNGLWMIFFHCKIILMPEYFNMCIFYSCISKYKVIFIGKKLELKLPLTKKWESSRLKR